MASGTIKAVATKEDIDTINSNLTWKLLATRNNGGSAVDFSSISGVHEILAIIKWTSITTSASVLLLKNEFTSAGNYYRFGFYAASMGWGYFKVTTTQLSEFSSFVGAGATVSAATFSFYYR